MAVRTESRGAGKLIVALAAFLALAVGGALFAVLAIEPDTVVQPPEADETAEVTHDDTERESESSDEAARPTAMAGPDGGAAADVAGTLRGVVRLYDSREPVAGLDLSLAAPPPEDDRKERQVLRTTSGPDGVFRFTGLHPGAGYELSGLRDPYAPIDVTGIAVAPGESLNLGTLWLAVPVDLPVEVIDATGAPVPEAEVSVFAAREAEQDLQPWSREGQLRRALAIASAPRPTASATTDKNGHAVVEGLRPDRYHVRATAEGFGADAKPGVIVSPDSGGAAVRLMLLRGHALVGTVLDIEGEPVAEARIVATATTSKRPGIDQWTGESGADGAYALSGLAAGRYQLHLVREGKPTLVAGQVGIPDTKRFDIRLRPTAVLHGTVTNQDGEPIEGAEIVYAPSGGLPLNARTDESGNYRIEEVPAGASQWFGVTAVGYVPWPDPAAPQAGTGESLREGSELRRDIMLEQGADAVLTVRDQDGNPVEGAKARLYMAQMWGGNNRPWEADTDEKGEARMTGLVPGTYLARIEARGLVQEGMPSNWNAFLQSPQAMPAQWRIDIAPESDTTHAHFSLARGGTVSGTVRSQAGEPVAGVRVTVSGEQSEVPVFTDQEGVFRAEAVPASLRAVARVTSTDHPAASSEPFIVEPGKEVKEIEITLTPGGRITGRVRTDDGSPVEGAVVRYVRGKISGSNPWAFRRFDSAGRYPVAEDGSFEITGVAPGSVTVRADAEGWLPAWDADVTVTADQETGGVDLIISGSTAFSGRVEGPGGEPVAGATINANYRGTDQKRAWGFVTGLAGNPSGQSDAEGRFTLSGLKRGKYSLGASAPGFVAANWVETTTGGGEVTLVLKAGERISGVVRDEDGDALGGVPVRAQSANNNNRGRNRWGGQSVYTAPDGSFELADLPEGAYDLTVSANWIWGRDVNVQDAVEQGVRTGRDDVEIQVKKGHLIEGNVTDEDDESVSVGWVSTRYEGQGGGSQRWSRMRSDGSFRVSGLVPGTYTLQAYGSFQPDTLKGVASGSSGVELRVKAGLTVRGVITDPKGLALATNPNIRMRPAGGEKWTGVQSVSPGDGSFTLVGLSEGAMDLQFQASRMAPVVVENVRAGEDSLKIVMQTGQTIKGIAVDVSGNPVRANVNAVQLNVPTGTTASSGWARCNEDGEFEIVGLAPGEYRLLVRASRVAPAILAPVQGGAEGVRAVLTPGETVTGKVVDSNGEPVIGARLQLFVQDGGTTVAWSTSKDDGTFLFEFVPEGGTWNLSGYIRMNGSRVPINRDEPVRSGETDVELTVE